MWASTPNHLGQMNQTNPTGVDRMATIFVDATKETIDPDAFVPECCWEEWQRGYLNALETRLIEQFPHLKEVNVQDDGPQTRGARTECGCKADSEETPCPHEEAARYLDESEETYLQALDEAFASLPPCTTG